VKGLVTFHDGTPVVTPTVFATRDDGSTTYADRQREDGTFLFYGLAPGNYVLTAQDANGGSAGPSGLTATRAVNVETPTSVLSADMVMPPTGTVRVRVLDAAGNQVTDATAALVSPSIAFDRRVGPWDTVKPDQNGLYVFDRVPLGPVYLQARRYACGGTCDTYASAGGSLSGAGESIEIDVSFAGLGAVQGRVLDASGNPATSEYVRVDIESFGSTGPLGNYRTSVSVNVGSDGSFAVGDVPPGAVQVQATPGYSSYGGTAGVANGVLAAGAPGPLTLDVTIGTGRQFGSYGGPIDITGGIYRFSIDGAGIIQSGGLTDGSMYDTLYGAAVIAVGGQVASRVRVGGSDLGGQQLTIGPTLVGRNGLLLTRRIYIPPDGRFVRYLDTLANPTGAAILTSVNLRSQIVGQPLVALSQPSATDAGFAVFDGVSNAEGASAYVFSGRNPPSLPTSVSFGQWGWQQALQTAWNVTVPAHGSVAVLHFVVQALPNEVAAVGTRARALAGLAEPDALNGISDEDLALAVNFRPPDPHVVNLRGTLVGADGHTPMPDRVIEVYQSKGNILLGAATSQPDTGAFNLDGLAVNGPGLVLRTVGASGNVLQMGVAVVQDGALPVTFITDWLYGSVRGSLRTFGTGDVIGEPFAVELRTLNGTLIATTTISDAEFSFGPGMLPAGALKVRVYVPGVPGGFVEGTTEALATGGQEVRADLALPESIYVHVRARVRALNHDESIDGAIIRLLRSDTLDVIATTTADRDGIFDLDVALPASGDPLTAPFIVRAESPTGSGISVQTELTATAQYEWIEPTELELPVSTAVGTVFYSDGNPVPFPTVFAIAQDGVARFADRTRADGSFIFYELTAGSYRLIGQDASSGLTAEFGSPVEMPGDTGNLWYLDFALPQTGTVVVRAVDGASAPIADATVALTADSLMFERRIGPNDVTKPDAEGRYVFERVPLGPVYLQGTWLSCPGGSCRYLFASASADLASTTEPLETQIAFTGYGQVRVSLPGSGTGNTLFEIEALGRAGALGSYRVGTTLQADSFLFEWVPPGPVRVVVHRDGQVAVAQGVLEPGADLGFDVALGSATAFPQSGVIDDWGEDGFHYRLDSGGRIASGGNDVAGTALDDTLRLAAALHIGDNFVCCSPVVGIDASLGGTQYTLGPMAPSFARGLVVTRKIFVPDVGGFARFHDRIANPTDAPVTVTIGVRSEVPGTTAGERGIAGRVDPSLDTGGYALIGAGSTGKYGESAYVYSGPAPKLLPSLVSFDFTRTDVARYEWRLTLWPHQEVALLHFVLQRMPGDLAGLTERAESLSRLTDGAMALNGLTGSDVAAIVNYDIAGNPDVSLEGTLRAADGTTRVEGQRIDFVDTVDNRVLQTTQSDSNGNYYAGGLFVRGAIRVRAWVPGLPGGSTQSAEFPVAGGGAHVVADVTMPPSVLTRIQGTVSAFDAAQDHREAIEGARLLVLHPETRALLAQTTADASGFFSVLVALPESGLGRLLAVSPTGSGTSVEVGMENHTQLGAVVNDSGLTLPITVVSGAVFRSGGEGVPNPTVFAQDAEGRTTFASISRADGTFVFYELPPGNYTLTAQDTATGITMGPGGAVTLATSTSFVWYGNVDLPPTGTVVVRPVDGSGNPVTNATLALVSDLLPFDRRVGPDEVVKPDASGAYVFEGVPYGLFYVQGRWRPCADGNCPLLYASVTSYLESAADPVTVPLAFSGYGQVQIDVIFPQSGPTLFGIEALGSAGPLGAFSMAVQLEATSFVFDQVPPGPIRATIRQNADVGAGEGSLQDGQPTPLVMAIYNNSATGFDGGAVNLDDEDGMRYAIGSGGEIVSGGLADEGAANRLTATLASAATLYVDGNPVGGVSAAQWDLDWRQLSFGPFAPYTARGLVFTRKLYVAPSVLGRGYARYLDIVENPTNVPITVTLSLRSVVAGAQGGARGVMPVGAVPRSLGYAVIGGVAGQYGTSAYVFGGVGGGPMAPSVVSFGFNQSDTARYEWRVTIPARTKIALLHFVAQRMPGDDAGIAALAQDLLDLTEYDVLVGLTAEERNMIINFSMPPLVG
jgi:hypothetical protein